MLKILIKFVLLSIFITSYSFAEIIKEIKITGNKRISVETISVIGAIKLNTEYDNDSLNGVLKNLYNSNFFKDVNVNLNNGLLEINVIENPIIEDIEITGLKNKSFAEKLYENITLKSRMSFTELQLENDVTLINNIMKSNGFYFSVIEPSIVRNDDLN